MWMHKQTLIDKEKKIQSKTGAICAAQCVRVSTFYTIQIHIHVYIHIHKRIPSYSLIPVEQTD